MAATEKWWIVGYLMQSDLFSMWEMIYFYFTFYLGFSYCVISLMRILAYNASASQVHKKILTTNVKVKIAFSLKIVLKFLLQRA